MKTQELHTRAMLVKLSISAWTARKYDRKVSQEVADSHGATIDAGRYNKHLLPADAPSYKALVQHIAKIRTVHYEQTLPWSDEGWRVLTVANYQKYTDLMREGKHTFEKLLSEFIADYPALKAEAQHRFNGLFNEDDYPANVRKHYDWDINIRNIPQGGDFRVQLSDEEIKILAANTEERTRQALQDAQADAVKRLYTVVANIVERLTATTKGEDGEIKPGIFRDSLIENARDLCDVLTRINLTDDKKLEEMRRKTEQLAKAEPQSIRENADVRKETAKQAKAILDSMRSTYGTVLSGGGK